jgi:membrane-associated phospholipid phosphatase
VEDLHRAVLIGVHGVLILIPFFVHRLLCREDFWSRLIATVYPFLFLILLYREVDVLNQLVSSEYHDQEIQALEQALLMADFRERLVFWFPYAWLEALLNAGYFSYYFLLPAVAIPLALKSQWDTLEEFVFISFLTYAICYALFIVYPVVGPFFVLHPAGSFDQKDWISHVTYTIVSRWGDHGAAFPSAHVAVAVVVVVLARHYRLASFWFLLPCAVGVTCGTVYCGYHYAVDVLAGILLAVAVLAVAPRLHCVLKRLSWLSAPIPDAAASKGLKQTP